MRRFFRSLFGNVGGGGSAGKVEIDGVSYQVGRDLVIDGRRILSDGRVLNDGEGRIVTVRVIGGRVGELRASGDVTCEAVDGSVTAGGNVRCGSVGGSVKAQGDVNCGSVGSNIVAGGDVVGTTRGR